MEKIEVLPKKLVVMMSITDDVTDDFPINEIEESSWSSKVSFRYSNILET